jgi:hypothetical protein
VARGGRIGVQRRIAAVVEPALAERDDPVGEGLRFGGRPVAPRNLPLDDVAQGGDQARTDTAVGRGHEAQAVVTFVGEECVEGVVARQPAQEGAGQPLDVLDALPARSLQSTDIVSPGQSVQVRASQRQRPLHFHPGRA